MESNQKKSETSQGGLGYVLLIIALIFSIALMILVSTWLFSVEHSSKDTIHPPQTDKETACNTSHGCYCLPISTQVGILVTKSGEIRASVDLAGNIHFDEPLCVPLPEDANAIPPDCLPLVDTNNQVGLLVMNSRLTRFFCTPLDQNHL